MSISTILVAKKLTEVLRFAPTTTGACALTVVLLPGNPGQIRYYWPFLEALHAGLPSAEIVGLTHLGHGDRSTGACDLQGQILHKVDFLREHVLVSGSMRRVVLIGHSIGAHIAVRAYERLDSHSKKQVAKIVALFPFLSVDPGAARQRLLRCLASVPAGVACLAACLGCLPLTVKKRLISAWAGSSLAEAAACLPSTDRVSVVAKRSLHA